MLALFNLENTNAKDLEDSDLAINAMHILRDHCVNCHNPKKSKGKLDLTTYQTARIGAVSYTHLRAPETDS